LIHKDTRVDILLCLSHKGSLDTKEEQKIIRGMIKDLQFLKRSIQNKFKS